MSTDPTVADFVTAQVKGITDNLRTEAQMVLSALGGVEPRLRQRTTEFNMRHNLTGEPLALTDGREILELRVTERSFAGRPDETERAAVGLVRHGSGQFQWERLHVDLVAELINR